MYFRGLLRKLIPIQLFISPILIISNEKSKKYNKYNLENCQSQYELPRFVLHSIFLGSADVHRQSFPDRESRLKTIDCVYFVYAEPWFHFGD